MIVKITAFWDVSLCTVEDSYEGSGETSNHTLNYQTHLLHLILTLRSLLHLGDIKTQLGSREVRGPLVSPAHLLHLEHIE
jgi:hypothetical protein